MTLGVSGGGGLQILLGASVQQLLGQVKYNQYMVSPMGFDLTAPVNLQEVNGITTQIAAFELLPVEEIYSHVLVI